MSEEKGFRQIMDECFKACHNFEYDAPDRDHKIRTSLSSYIGTLEALLCHAINTQTVINKQSLKENLILCLSDLNGRRDS